MSLARLLVPASTLAVLVYLASAFAGVLVYSGLLASATWLEAYVLGIQILKTALMFLLKDLRRASPALAIDLYGLDLLILPVLGGAYLATGAPVVASAMTQLIVGWLPGVALGGLFYSSYRIGKSMLGSGELKTIIPGSLISAEIALSFEGSAISAQTAGKGLAGLVPSILSGAVNPSPGGISLFAALAVLFASLIAFASNGTHWEGQTAVNLSLLFAFLCVSTVGGFAVLMTFLALPISLAFVPLTLAAVAVSWWAGREK